MEIRLPGSLERRFSMKLAWSSLPARPHHRRAAFRPPRGLRTCPSGSGASAGSPEAPIPAAASAGPPLLLPAPAAAPPLLLKDTCSINIYTYVHLYIC